MEDKKMLSVAEAAKAKGVTSQAIRAAIQAGRLKGFKSGGVFLVDADSLATYTPAGNKGRLKPSS